MTDIHDIHPICVKKALRLEWILISYNTLEAAASIFFGISAESVALIGFGLDSIIEVACAGILIWRLVCHSNVEDEEAREKKALFFVGVTFFLLAAYVGYESISKLLRHEVPQVSIAGIVIAALSMIIMPSLGLAKRKIAKQIKSKALEADATETMICAYLSVILLIGLGLNALFGWWWADPIAGFVMVYFLIKEGREAVSGEDCCGKECR
jgi:divalent metal cation (Fe/Co/Zn/Cd) transporter